MPQCVKTSTLTIGSTTGEAPGLIPVMTTRRVILSAVKNRSSWCRRSAMYRREGSVGRDFYESLCVPCDVIAPFGRGAKRRASVG